MSRGYSLTNPKEIKLTGSCVVFDGCGWIWIFQNTKIVKVFIRDILNNTQKYIDDNLNSLTATVAIRDGSYNSAVLVDDHIFVADSIFDSILKINVSTHAITEIRTPVINGSFVKMNSNLHFANSKLWMVTNDTTEQINDQHKMYVLDVNSNQWNWSYINTKKQQEGFRIWSNGNDYVYTSNWTNFNCSYFDSVTGTYIGSFDLNGYPGFAADTGGHTSYVTSYGGMISFVNGTTVTHTHNSIAACNEFGSHIAYIPGYIWFQNSDTFGRITLADKNVIDSSAEDDTVILKSVGQDTVDAGYIDQIQYSITNSEFKDLFVVPQYVTTDEMGDPLTMKDLIVLHGTTVTVFDPDLVKFVFDKPEVKNSYVFNTGKAMITTGDTGYIGEFK